MLPGPRAPRIAQSLAFGLRPAEYLIGAQRRYGDTFALRIVHEGTWVVVSDPASVRDVLRADPEVARAGEGNAFLSPLLGRNTVITMDAPEHLERRRALLGPLHGDAHEALITRVVAETVRDWRPGTRLDLLTQMRTITLEVILRTVLGDTDRIDAARRRVRALLFATTSPAALAAVGALGYRLAAWHPALHLVRAPVRRLLRREVAERSGILEALSGDLDDRALRDEALTLIVAGVDTTATALAWAADCLLHAPEAAARAREDDTYLQAAVKESLRLRPVVPLIVRRLAAPLQVGERELPAGVAAVPCALLLHRRPDLYPEPDAFRPERFLDRQPGTYEWLPFGGGQRRCLGASFALLELTVVLRHLLRATHLAPARGPEAARRRAQMLAPRHGVEVDVV
jgi:cytochrome P450